MSKIFDNLNVFDLIKKLENENFIQDSNDINNFIIKRQQEKELPLYTKILFGVGSLITFIFFFIVLVDAKFLKNGGLLSLTIFSLFIIAIVIAMQLYTCNDKLKLKNLLFAQLSFVFISLLKFFWGNYLFYYYNSLFHVVLFLLIIAISTYNIYNVYIDRFLSVLSILLLTFISILFHLNEYVIYKNIFLNLFFCCQLVLALFLFTYDKVDKKYYPVSYALIVSIIIITVYNSIIHNEQYNTNVILHINNEFTHFLELYSINLSFVLSLIYIFIYTYNDIKILESKILTVFSILLLIIGFIYSPALLLAMGLLFLGYYKRDNFLIFLGISLFLFFLGYYYYYYNEYISLLHKSIIFLISGTSFLIMGFYIKHRLSICKKN